MKHPTLSLLTACAVLALQGCDVRVADNSAPAQPVPPAAPVAETQVQTAPAPVEPTPVPTVAAPAGIPAQQPTEPLDAQVAVAPQDAASATIEPQASAMPGTGIAAPAGAEPAGAPPAGAVMGGPGTPSSMASSAQGMAAPTEMSEFFANAGTETRK
jgi:hypothetical protein